MLRAAPTLVLRLIDGDGSEGSQALVATHRADPRGAPLLGLANDDPLVERVRRTHGSQPLDAVVEAWSLVPVPVVDRVRGWVRLDGSVEELDEGAQARLAPRLDAGNRPQDARARTVLRLDVAEVTLMDGRGQARVAPADYAAAVPDPLVDDEPTLLEHVASAHSREVALLGRLAERVAGHAVADPMLVGLDRFGVRVRVRRGCCRDDGTLDVHLPFAGPLRHPGELTVAVAVLLERGRRCAPAPHLGGP